jgi:FkbM family methyltransferase
MTPLSLQPFFRLLHRIALRGMNYGGGGHHDESGELAVLQRLTRLWPRTEALCLMDAGANKGDYTAALASAFQHYPHAQIWALEPSLSTFARLEKKIAASSFKDRIAALNIGLGQREETIPFYAPADAGRSGLSSVYPRRLNHFGVQLEKSESIHLLPLDALCAQKGIAKIHFLKLDLEGHELAALEGASTLLREQRLDAIQFEFGGCNIDSRTYFQDFYYRLAPDFALYRILQHGMDPVNAYKEEQEIFITTNYLAVRKDVARLLT